MQSKINTDIFKYFLTSQITLLDAGSKGGVFSLQMLDPFVQAYGLEPDKSEYMKLISKKNENSGLHHVRYFQEALGDKNGMADFFLATNASYNSLLEADIAVYEKHNRFMRPFTTWKKNISPVRKTTVHVITLDKFTGREKIPYISLLKLDVQGSELDILKGAEALFQSNSIDLIYTEVSFTKVYKNQALFSDIDQYLRGKGFDFIDCRFSAPIADGNVRPLNKSNVNFVEEMPRYQSGGDAVYAADFSAIPENTRNVRVIHAAMILAQLGYYSYSGFILEKYSSLDSQAIKNLILYCSSKTTYQRLKSFGMAWCPPILLPPFSRFLNRIKRVF